MEVISITDKRADVRREMKDAPPLPSPPVSFFCEASGDTVPGAVLRITFVGQDTTHPLLPLAPNPPPPQAS